jgi:hypothetical protein
MVPVSRLKLAAQQPQQRSLAAAVGADQADLHAGSENEVQVL